MIPAERFDSIDFNGTYGKSLSKNRRSATISLFGGETNLLKYAPSTRLLWTLDVRVANGEICFDAIVWSDEAIEQIKRDWHSCLQALRTQIGHSTNEVNGFNSRLEVEATKGIQQRKADILKKRNLLGSLGVAIKTTPNVPSTFSVPIPKKVIVSKPSASTAPFAPEPTLDSETYNEILKLSGRLEWKLNDTPAFMKEKTRKPCVTIFSWCFLPTLTVLLERPLTREEKRTS